MTDTPSTDFEERTVNGIPSAATAKGPLARPEVAHKPEADHKPEANKEAQGMHPPSEDWAPYDYSDGRENGYWKTRYPQETAAAKLIFRESRYLVIMLFLYLMAAFYLIYRFCEPNQMEQTGPTYLGFVGAWVGGVLGGCIFGMKWMYHSVAKFSWNEDRHLWRLFVPHISGVVALFMVLLISSNLVQVFDKAFVTRPAGVMAFSFIMGYFSDKALAKMAEIADTFFGGREHSKQKLPRPR